MHFLFLHLVSFCWVCTYQPTGIALAVITNRHNIVMQDRCRNSTVGCGYYIIQGSCRCWAGNRVVGGWSSIHIDHLLLNGKFCIIKHHGGRGAGIRSRHFIYCPYHRPQAVWVSTWWAGTEVHICSPYYPTLFSRLLRGRKKGHCLWRFLKNRAKIVSSIRERPV